MEIREGRPVRTFFTKLKNRFLGQRTEQKPEDLITPLTTALTALANTKGIVGNFHNVLVDYAVQGDYAKELTGVFEFGIAASHVSNAPHDAFEHGYENLEIDVLPLATKSPDAKSAKATLLGITEAWHADDGKGVEFTGLAVMGGNEITINNAVKVIFDSKTRLAHIHPNFAEKHPHSALMSTPGL